VYGRAMVRAVGRRSIIGEAYFACQSPAIWDFWGVAESDTERRFSLSATVFPSSSLHQRPVIIRSSYRQWYTRGYPKYSGLVQLSIQRLW
jgi:hypothetical protein